MANRYYNIDGTKVINQDYPNISVGFDRVQTDMDAATAEREAIDGRVDGLKTELDAAVFAGDSSPAAAQAAVDASGHNYGNLKLRLDTEHTQVAEQLAETAADMENGFAQVYATKANKTEVNALATEKASITYVNEQVASVASGAPDETFASLAALQAAYPTGNAKNKLVEYEADGTTYDGHIYRWNGSVWINTGIKYQQTGISNDAVKIPYLDNTSRSDLYTTSPKNLFNPYKAHSGFVDCLNVFSPSASLFYTERIAVTAGEALFFTNNGVDVQARFVTPLKADGSPYATTSAQIVFVYNYVIPSGVTDVILTFNTSNTKLGITKSLPFVYEPYYIFKPIQYVKSKNLFDKSSATDGLFINWTTGNTNANTDYWYSGYIEVEPNTVYTQSHETHLAFYTDSKTFISGIQRGTGFKTFTTPSNAKYVRVSLTPLASKNIYQLEKGSVSTTYIGYGYTLPSAVNNRPFVIPSAQNNWAGKNADSLGDSITAQGKWQPYVHDKLGLSVFSNHGIGGTRISGTGTDSMCNDVRIDALDSAATLITAMGGTNDWVNDVPLGTASSTDVETFYGAVKTMAEKLIMRFPTARIVLMTTPYGMYPGRSGWTDTTGLRNNLGLTTGDYGKVIMEAARLYGLPCIDIYGNAGWSSINIASYVTNDGAYLHPNDAGAQRLAEVLIGTLKVLEPLV